MAVKYKSSVASSTTLTNANAWADNAAALGTAASVGPATGDIIQFRTGSLGVLASGAGYTGAVDVSGATGGIVQYGTLTPTTNNAKFGGLVSIGGAGIVQDVTNTTNLEFVGGVSVGATDQTWVSYTTKSGTAGLALGSALSGSATITLARPATGTLPGYLYSYATASAFTGTIVLSANTSLGVNTTGTQHAIGPNATIRIAGDSTELYPTTASAVLSSKVVVAAGVTFSTGNLTTTTYNLNLNNATAALDVGANAPTINVRTSGGLTVSGPFSGTAGFTKSGAGPLSLSAANPDLSGTITVSAGTLNLGAAGTTGTLPAITAVDVASTGTFQYNRTDALTWSVPITGAGTFGVGSTGTITTAADVLSGFTGTLSIGSTGGLTTAESADRIFAAFNGTGTGTWTKNGTGKVTFSGASTHAGSWNINTGDLVVNGAVAAGGTVTVGASGKLTGTGAISKNVVIPAGSTGNDFTVGGASAVTVNGTAVVNGNTTGRVSVGSTGAATINGSTGDLSLAGTGTTLSATANTSGQMFLGAAAGACTLTVPAGRTITTNVLGGSGDAQGHFLGFEAGAPTAVYQTGAGSLVAHTRSSSSGFCENWLGRNDYAYYHLGAGAVTTASNSHWSLFRGVFEGRGGNLTVGGVFKLYGHISFGSLAFFSSGTHTAASTLVGVNSTSYVGGFCGITASGLSTSVSLGPVSSTLTTGGKQIFAATDGATLSTGGLTVTGTGPAPIVYVSGGATFATTGTVPAGVSILLRGTGNKLSAGSGTGTIASPITAATGRGLASVALSSAGSGYIGPPTLNVTTTGSGVGAVVRAQYDVGTQTITGIEVVSAGSGYAVGDVINVVVISGNSGSGFAAGAIALTDPLTAADVEKVQSGTLVLTATNTYTGATTVSAGTLQIGAGAAAGSIDTSSGVSLAANTNLYYGRSDAKTWSLPITFGGNNKFGTASTGALTVSTGFLGDAGFNGALYVNSTGALTTNESADLTLTGFGGAGTGAWTKNGTGKVTFNGASTHTGAWNINAGDLVVNGTVAAGGTLTMATSNKLTGTGAISKNVVIPAGSTGNDFTVGGTSAVTVNGTATISGTHAGTTTVSSTGDLTAVAQMGSVTVASGGRAVLSNTATGTLTVQGLRTTLTPGAGKYLGALSFTGTANKALTLPDGWTVYGDDRKVPATAADGAAALYQTGATSLLYSGSTDFSSTDYSFGVDAAYGYYRGTAGTITNRSYFGSAGNSVVELAGVTADVTRFGLAFSNSAHVSTFSVLPGTSINGPLMRIGVSSSPATTDVTVNVDAGSDYPASFSSYYPYGNLPYTTRLNICRGSSLAVGTLSVGISSSVQGSALVSVWGGRLYLGASPPVNSRLPAPKFYGSGNRLGASAGTTVAYAHPIAPPTGFGIYQINVVNPGTGYIGPPSLLITGGTGTGASARAVWDPVTAGITSVEITSPGTGYVSTDASSIVITPYGGGGTGFSANVPGGGLAANTSTAAPVSYSPDMVFDGAGTLQLTADNTYTGTSTISAGVVQLGSGASNNTGTLGPSSTASPYGTSNAILSGGTLGFNRNENLTYAGTISGTSTSGGISKLATTAAVTATISGNNTFLAPISVAGGTLRATHANAFGSPTATANITVASGAAEFDAGASSTITSDRGLTIAGTGISSGGAVKVSSGSVTLNGAVSMTATGTSVDAAGTTSSLTLNGVVSGTTATFTFTKGAGTGTLTLGNAANTFTGAVTVSGGTLSYRWASNNGVAGSLGAGSASVTVANGATLDYSGTVPASTNRVVSFSTAAAGEVGLSASGAAPITYTAAPTITATGTAGATKTLVLGGSAERANKFDAVIANPGGTGGFALAKRGNGYWALSRANTFTADVTVEAGRLVAVAEDASKRFGATSGAQKVTVKTGARIQTLTGINQKGKHTYNNLTFESGGYIRIGGALSTGTIQMNGNLTISGAVTWNLTDRMYKTPGTYDLMVFLSGGLVGGSASLSNVAVTVPTGWGVSATNLRYDTGGTYPTIKVDVDIVAA